MSETARWALPLLAAGQAQKEMGHNEALAAVDLLLSPSVMAVGLNTPPVAPTPGQGWIVGTAPTGAWSGKARALAGWTAGGWRFAAPCEGMTAWNTADGAPATYLSGEWRLGRVSAGELGIGGQRGGGARGRAIAAAAGGAVVDVEARAALAQVVASLVAHGLIAA